MMNRFRKNQRKQHHGATSTKPTVAPVVVGTEKLAQKELLKNSQLYHYPTNGFINKIEYTLLYNMLYYPDIYPIHVIHPMILEEDYTQYIYIHERPGTSTTTTTEEAVPPGSYAQLTALLALAAEKWPPSSSNTNTTTPNEHSSPEHTRHQRTSRDYNENDNDDDDEYEYESSRRRRQQQQQQATEPLPPTPLNVVPTLCQLIIQCIIRHCETYSLDRETEINELFRPFQKVTSDQTTQRALLSTLPAYMGLTVTILSGGNPIPFYIGYAYSIHAISQQEQNLQNYQEILNTTTRMSHHETTNLLHDTDH